MKAQSFCKTHGTAARTAFYAALSLEEMAGNIVRHGFALDKRRYNINFRVVYKQQNILLRIKDDCIPFNPKEWMELVVPNTL